MDIYNYTDICYQMKVKTGFLKLYIKIFQEQMEELVLVVASQVF